jgi:ribosomal protein L39E
MTINRLGQNRTSPQHIMVKTLSTESKDRILKASRKKKH